MRHTIARSSFFGLATLLMLASCAGTDVDGPPGAAASSTELAVGERARELHDRILVLDTHLDTPALFSQPGWSILEDNRALGGFSQVDYPRMLEGGLDGGLWVIYTPQGDRSPEANLHARDHALTRLVEIRELVAANPDKFEIAYTADDIERIASAGRKVVMLSIENASPLATDPSLLGFFHSQGVRSLGLTHIGNNEFGDSSNPHDDVLEWNGLSPAGVALVAEANRLGILLDQSHSNDLVFDQLIELSPVPFLLSHTTADAIYGNPRNIDDDRLRRLAEHGGVIHVNAYGGYIKSIPTSPERQAALSELYAEFGNRSEPGIEGLRELAARRDEIDRQYPIEGDATFDDYLEHLLHIIEVAGPDHVGIGADWDGGGGLVGFEHIGYLPRVTEALIEAGYSDEQIANIWGGNLLRILRQAEDYAAGIAAPAAGE